MDFKDIINQLATRILNSKDLIKTEEATKHAYVMPLIQALGYDVFNPLEVVPEFIADIGIKKGEKVDYAIMLDGKPTILIECKHWSADLNPHNSQLFRYFHTCNAKFSILTNGIETRFYTDLEQANKMDERPFFTFRMDDIRDTNLEELRKFHKSYFDTNNILSAASELKYVGLLKGIIGKEVQNPSPDFVKYFAKQVNDGPITQKVLELFTALTKKSFHQYIGEEINKRLKTALKAEKETQAEEDNAVKVEINKPAVVTTEVELEGFLIIRAIMRKVVDVNRVVHRDTQSYFSILLDDNNRKPLCRLQLDGKKKFIHLFNNANKEAVRHEIETLEGIYAHADALIETFELYEAKP